MCDGGISGFAIASAVLTAISTAIGTVGAIQQGKATKAQYEYQAKVAQKNAKIAEDNAANERQSGLEESRLQRMKVLSQIGSQQAAMAANGIDITSGTALDTIEDTAQMGELDALMIQYNSERTAQNFDAEANNFKNQANLDKLAARNVSTGSKLNALGTAVSGLASMSSSLEKLDSSKISSKWKQWKNGTPTSGSAVNLSLQKKE